MNEDNPKRTLDERARVRFVRRLEALAYESAAHRFLKLGPGDFLTHQESIFKLQTEIQAAISACKKRSPKSDADRAHLESLRRLRWFSRRVGDSAAWSILLYNRQLIHALSQNKMVPVPAKETDGTRGVFLMARNLASPEWGLPIVHDITSILRVGDITFMRPHRRPNKAVHQTFELKTTRTAEVPEPDGTSVVTLSVQLFSNEEFPEMPHHIRKSTAGQDSPPPPARRPDRRLTTQLRRMDRALVGRDAPIDEITRFENEAIVNLSLAHEPDPHWAELRRAIRQARRDGYGFFALDGFVGYALFYNRAGVTETDFKAPRLLDDVKRLVLHEDLGARNSLTISTVPDEERDPYSARVLPVYLWEVPQNAIRDILRGRLVISAAYNAGRIEHLLHAEGVPTRRVGKDSRDFVCEVPLEWSTGESVRVDLHAPWGDMFTAVHEFRGAASVVQRTLAVRDLPKRLSFDRFEQGSLEEAS